jgi:phage shock protein A
VEVTEVLEEKFDKVDERIRALEMEIDQCRARKRRWEEVAEEIRARMESLRTMALDEAYNLQNDIADLTDHLNALLEIRDKYRAAMDARDKRNLNALIREDNRQRM